MKMKTAILLCILLSVLGIPPAILGCWDEYYSEQMICITSQKDNCTIGNLTWSEAATCDSFQCVHEKLRERKNLMTVLFEVGCPGQSIIKCNNDNEGLAFNEVRNLTLVGLTLLYCGTIQKSTSINITRITTTAVFRSSVYIWNCIDVSIENVSIKNSSGNALAFFNTNGRVTVTNSHLEWNMVPDVEAKIYPGGGGVYVEFTNCPPGNCCERGNNTNQRNNNSNYTFQRCTFSNNYASNIDHEKTSFFNSTRSNFQGFGRGGGLCIIFRGDAVNNSIEIKESNFSQNSALWGGGLYITFHDSSERNKVTVRTTSFEQNSACDNAGGGASVGHVYLKGKTLPQGNIIEFYNCTFSENKAKFGGGTFIYSSQSKISYEVKGAIKFQKCTWLKNMARYGSAVDISPHSRHTLSYGLLPIPVFEDCEFKSNLVIHKTNKTELYKRYKIGRGAFLASSFYIIFSGNICFDSNNGTAMYLTSSTIEFANETNATFVNNTGFEGGAIALIGFSSLFVKDQSTVMFVNNTALNKGGAIYFQSIDKHDYVSSHSCFIQYKGHTKTVEQRNVIFNFSGNRVIVSGTVSTNMTIQYGHSIFATSLKPCMYACSTKLASELFNCIGTFTYNNQSANDTISSSGETFITDENQTFPLQVIPGHEFLLPISIIDDFQHTVRAVYHVKIENDNADSNIKTDEAYSYLYDKRMILFGKPNSTGTLELFKTGFREVAISFKVELLECPPGYVLDSYTRFSLHLEKCICARETKYPYPGLSKCNNTVFKAYLNRGYWIGYVNNETESGLLSAHCPCKFCSYSRSRNMYNALPGIASKKELDYHVCGPTRTGILCAKCIGNYSIYYHSTYLQCGKDDHCHIGWLLYILSELLPLTVLFLIVIIFNISFTSGAANGFIFFAQVLDSLSITANDYIRLPRGLHFLTETFHFIYRFFNFDFFSIKVLSFCLWKDATTLDVLAFKYVTVMYGLILVVLTVTIMNICNCYRICSCIRPRTVKSSVIHGLSAFLVMCYMQCAKVSFQILTPIGLYSRGYNESRTVVFRHGEIDYFSRDHLPYAIPATFCLITIVLLPTILLLVYPAHYKALALFKLNESRKMQQIARWISIAKLKPLFDSLQSCYKDKCRFFAGLYFLYRLLILGANVFTRSYKGFYTLVELVLILMLIIHALAQPYRKRWHNTVDTLLFADLAIINGLTLYNYSTLSYDEWRGIDTVVTMTLFFQVLLIYLPMIYMAVYVLYILVQLAPKTLFFLFPKIRIYLQKRKEDSVPLNDTEFPARLIEEDEASESDCSGELATEYKHFEDYELNDFGVPVYTN